MIMSVYDRIKRFFGIGSCQSMPEDGKEAEQLISTHDEEAPAARSYSRKKPIGYKVLVRYVGGRFVNRYSDIWVKEDCMYVIDKKGTKPETAIDLLRELSFWKDYRYAKVGSLKKAMPEVVVAKSIADYGDASGIIDLNTL